MSWLKKVIAAIRRLWNRIFGPGPAPETLRATVSASPPGPAPGVGVCLSGGGSRALVAGLGQLRALGHLQANGQSLLEQVAALSTVSGGSWLGVPWVYLPSGTSDADYLNGYVADPGRLVLRPTPGHSDAEVLDHLPPGNPGANIARRFEIEDLTTTASPSSSTSWRSTRSSGCSPTCRPEGSCPATATGR